MAARLGPRDGTQEPLRIGMPRPAQQLLARALLHDLAGVHDGDPVGHHVHHAEIVGDEEHCRAGGGGEVADQLKDLGADGGVERRGRLVADEEARAHGHGHGDHHPLLEAAGELVRVGVDAHLRVRDADHAEHLDSPPPRLAGGDPGVEQDRLLDLAADGRHRVEARHRLLEDHADLAAAQRAHLRHGQREQVAAVEADAAVGLDASGPWD